MAFGANPSNVRNLFTLKGVSVCSLGLLIGVVAMLLLSPTLADVLFETSPLNISMFGLTAIFIIAAAAIAVLIPSRQAQNIQPTQALKSQ